MDLPSFISASLVFFYLGSIQSVLSVECFSCTYTFAGAHGTYDQECVTAVRNFTKTRLIQCQYFCTTKAVYQRGYVRLNSLYRGCGFKKERYCSSPKYIIGSCEETCTQDDCNGQNGNLWPSMKPKPPHHRGGGGGGGRGKGGVNRPYYFGIAVTWLLWICLLL